MLGFRDLGRCPRLAWTGPLALRRHPHPLAEQRRIMATVEQLMAWVDALETQLTATVPIAEPSVCPSHRRSAWRC